MEIRDGIGHQEDEICSFLLIGQSNMAGRGEFGEVAPIDNPRCYMLRMGRWQKMREPINPDRGIFEGKFHSGVGLGASFADGVANAFGIKVGLIPCADGGTALSQWMPGEVLFDHAVLMTQLARRSSRLGGILWHQGESDCSTEANVAAYKEKFITMITALRQALGAEELPLLIGKLSEQIGAEWGVLDRPRRLNAVFEELARELPHTATVSAQGLSLKPDNLHFDAAAQRAFGTRYFEAYRTLLG
ncbi:MAG: sialate O-acetylesterase [Clostridia bacterium]|nr:sialate O-acetylesterase [Clostridia bacterium]